MTQSQHLACFVRWTDKNIAECMKNTISDCGNYHGPSRKDPRRGWEVPASSGGGGGFRLKEVSVDGTFRGF